MGRVRFLVFYLLGGLRGDRAPDVRHARRGHAPSTRQIPNLGASGAVSGVLGAYLVLLPTASVLTLVFYFLRRGARRSSSSGSGSSSSSGREASRSCSRRAGGGVAFFAHIGGFVFGVADGPPVRGAPTARAGRTDGRRGVRGARAQRRSTRCPPSSPAGSRTSPSSSRTRSRRPGILGSFYGYPPAERTPPGPCRRGSSIYRLPLEDAFADPAELEREIRITVLHELAHYFGIDEDRIAELGYRVVVTLPERRRRPRGDRRRDRDRALLPRAGTSSS